MRRLAQFVRLRASRVCLRLSASVSRLSRVRLRLCASASVCVCLFASVSRLLMLRVPNARVCSRLASVCVCSRQGFRMRASMCVSRLSASVCVCLFASVSRLFTSRVPNACVCVCVRLLASASRVCVRLCASRVPNASVCVCVCLLASVCVGRLVSRRSSCLASACECLRELAHFMRRSSFKEFKRFLLSSYYRCTYRLCRLYEQTFNILI